MLEDIEQCFEFLLRSCDKEMKFELLTELEFAIEFNHLVFLDSSKSELA